MREAVHLGVPRISEEVDTGALQSSVYAACSWGKVRWVGVSEELGYDARFGENPVAEFDAGDETTLLVWVLVML